MLFKQKRIFLLFLLLLILVSCGFSEGDKMNEINSLVIKYHSFIKDVNLEEKGYSIEYDKEKLIIDTNLIIHERKDYSFYKKDEKSYITLDSEVIEVSNSNIEKYAINKINVLKNLLNDLLKKDAILKKETNKLSINTRYGFIEIKYVEDAGLILFNPETKKDIVLTCIEEENVYFPNVDKQNKQQDFLGTFYIDELFYYDNEFDVFDYTLNETNETKFNFMFTFGDKKHTFEFKNNFQKEQSLYSKSVYSNKTGKTVYNSNNIELDSNSNSIIKHRLIEIETDIVSSNEEFDYNGNLIRTLNVRENLSLYYKENCNFEDENYRYEISMISIGIENDFEYTYSWINGVNKTKAMPIDVEVIGYVDIVDKESNEKMTVVFKGDSITANISNVTNSELKKVIISYNSQILIMG